MRLTSTKIVRGIMIPAVTLAIALVVGESLRSPFGHTDRLDTTEHVIMGHPFEVPKAYLILREQWVPSEWVGEQYLDEWTAAQYRFVFGANRPILGGRRPLP